MGDPDAGRSRGGGGQEGGGHRWGVEGQGDQARDGEEGEEVRRERGPGRGQQMGEEGEEAGQLGERYSPGQPPVFLEGEEREGSVGRGRAPPRDA